MVENNDLMDVDGLCEYLQTSRSTVYKLAQDSMVPAKKVGRLWRFNRDEIDSWLHTQTGADTLADIRGPEVGDRSRSGAAASWENQLTEVGFSKDQIDMLLAFSFDCPSKIVTAMATKAGRAGLCKALKTTEDKLDSITAKLIAATGDKR
jgi:excisionase family DNA binding protein